MEKFKWIVYGLDMDYDVIIESEGIDRNDSHAEAVAKCELYGLDFDTIEPFNKSFVNRLNWLND
ncbi:hypothetical protein [Bacillus sp. AG4(2022)]|uniref:hypothetical protein n=1 Tax=Bacillus sp. AG4(2022) TaxID=2962594 RepID=UPI002882317C|nr:hypothetical protein [Bacillus sp. AG4(2022)]MDT0160330.1 hypothetical protein [Bacillus sp. AG4(2022)]